jgi:DNA-binding SARP family transcriptional activator
LPHLQRAVAAYGGEFGPGLPDTEWVETRRSEFARAAAQALSDLGRLLANGRRYDEAAEVYRTAVTRDPLDEAAHRHLMTCLSNLGEIGQAAREYEQLVRRLHTELGVAPARETRDAYERLKLAD